MINSILDLFANWLKTQHFKSVFKFIHTMKVIKIADNQN